MRIKYLFLLIAGLAINKDTYAQGYAADALRFSQYQLGSTARIKALGNSQIAVGGDISSIGGNPAGLGLFTRSEFSLTTEIMRSSSESSYFNQNANASRGKVNINNLGAVFFIRLGKNKGADLTSGAISLNLGLGYNKTNDFGNKISFGGTNNQSSIANFYADLANDSGDPLSDGSLEHAAFEGNLINKNTNGTYVSVTNTGRNQNEVIIRNGSQSEFNLSAGLNISNKLYLGTSIGLLSLNYSSDNTFTENGTLSYTANGGYTENYRNDYFQRFEAKGSGINMKVGVIFRPSQYFRIGAAAQTPNVYVIDDTYSESNQTKQTDNPYFADQTVTSETNFYDMTYALSTPAKYSLGAALFENKFGFISGDIEFLDYSSMKLKNRDSNADFFVDDNREIVNNYKNATNYKLGVEIKAAYPFLLRGGYSFNESPVENSEQALDVQTYSLGGGYRFGNINLDIAYLTSSFNSQVNPYLLNSGVSPLATSKTTKNGIFISLSTRF